MPDRRGCQMAVELFHSLFFRRVGTRQKVNKHLLLCFGLLAVAFWLFVSYRGGPSTPSTPRTLDKVKSMIANNRLANQQTPTATSETIKKNEEVDSDVVSPHNYNYIINEELKCRTDGPRNFFSQDKEQEVEKQSSSYRDVYMLICVSSAPSHYDRRLAIRQAWANAKAASRLKVVILFMMGTSSGPQEQMRVKRESDTFHDVIQEDFVDSYLNLSVKSVMGLKWASVHCPNVDYYMKTDDDVYVNVELVVEFLRIYGQQRWIGGCLKQRKSPKPLDGDGQPVTFTFGHPEFVAGAGYVLSGDILAPLYQAALRRPIVPVEDAFITGYCAGDIGVSPSHYDGFSCGESVTDDCQMKIKFVGHHVTTEKQFQIWRTLHNVKSSCPEF